MNHATDPAELAPSQERAYFKTKEVRILREFRTQVVTRELSPMDEALDRSPRRLRFTLRGALIAIFFIALILGGIDYIRRESRLVQFAHEQLTLQRDVTEAVLAKA